jgi:hypothetical protein
MARKDISEKCWDAAMKRASDPNTWKTDISAGSYFDSEGNAFGSSSGYICHAFMLYRGASNDEPFVFVNDTKLSKNQSEEALVRKYYKYICQESPFRNFVLNNDNIDQLVNGGAIIDCRAAGSNETLWICKAMRYPVEEPYRVKYWDELTTFGVHPMLALCVASCVTPKFTDSGGQTHASVFCPPTTKEELKALFVDHLPDAKNWYTRSDTDFCTTRVFVSTSNLMWNRWEQHILPLPKHGGIQKKVPDGWGGYTMITQEASVKDVAEELIKLQKEYTE